MATMNETTLHNTQAETEVLSAILQDENIYTSVRDRLDDSLFYGYDTRNMYSIVRKIEKEGRIPTLSEAGIMYASEGGNTAEFYVIQTISFSLVSQKISLLQDLAKRRLLYNLCMKGITIATNPMLETGEFDKILSDLKDVGGSDTEVTSFKDSVISLQNDVAKRMQGEGSTGLMTGLHVFDVRTGWHTGDLVIVAGRTSQGKSSCALTIASNMAMEGIPSVFYSMEMGADKLTARITARYASIASSRILYEKMNEGEYKKFYDTSSDISELPIYFDERNKTSFQKICTSIRAMVRKHGIKIAFIDYLQILANSVQNANREQLIGDMARELKQLAVECDICVVALSQLARNPQNPEPTIGELRGSGQIEEAADVVVLVYRPSVYGIERWSDGMPTHGTARIEIGKGRNIGLAKEIVSFNGELTFFEDYTETREEIQHKTVDPWKEQETNLPF